LQNINRAVHIGQTMSIQNMAHIFEAHMAHALVGPVSSAVQNSVTPRASDRALAYS